MALCDEAKAASGHPPWVLSAVGGVAVLVAAAALVWARLADPPATDLAPPAVSALAAATPDLDLPMSSEPMSDTEPATVRLIVTRAQMVIAGDPRPYAAFPEGVRALGAEGLPARDKRFGPRDLYLTDLGSGLAFWRGAVAAETDAGSRTLTILADRTTPYRVLVEVLFTAAEAQLDRFQIAVRAPGARVGSLTVRGPSASPGPDGVPVIYVHDSGFAVRTSAGNVAPGCDDTGAGAAVPKVAGAYDVHALAACLRKIKDRVPGAKNQARAALVAGPAVDLQTIVSAIEAVKGTKGDSPLFPDIQLGLPSAQDDALGHAPIALASVDEMRTGSAHAGSRSTGSVPGASRVVASMAPAFRRCYRQGLAEDPRMKGSVRLAAEIGSKGEVLSVTPSSASLSPSVVTCLSARVWSAHFEPPEGGNATIVIPLTFVDQ